MVGAPSGFPIARGKSIVDDAQQAAVDLRDIAYDAQSFAGRNVVRPLVGWNVALGVYWPFANVGTVGGFYLCGPPCMAAGFVLGSITGAYLGRFVSQWVDEELRKIPGWC